MAQTCWRRHRASLLVVALVVAVRVAMAIAGTGFDLTGLTGRVDYYQLLDTSQLQHHLASSIWNLHSQPPLFDLWSGVMLQLPHGWIPPMMATLSVGASLVLALSTYHLGRGLHLPVAAASIITVLVVLDPANLLYSIWYFDTYPTAVALTFGALCLTRLGPVGRGRWWAAGFATALAVVVLGNSTFQWLWLLAAVLPVLWMLRQHPRQFLIVMALPLLVVTGWYAKNAVRFHTATTSSWLGMNMAKVSLGTADAVELHRLVEDGTLTPLALRRPFAPLDAYAGLYAPSAPTGSPVLDLPTKHNGVPNYNAASYIPISSQYLHDDLTYISRDPLGYARGVSSAVRLFFFPSDRYVFLWPQARHLTAYQNAYDTFIDGDIRPNDFAIVTPGDKATAPRHDRGSGPQSWDQISLTAVLAFFVLLALGPVAAWRMRTDRRWLVTMGFVWMTSAYVLVLTSLADLGENLRFRYDLGPLPLLGAAATLYALARRRCPPRDEGLHGETAAETEVPEPRTDLDPVTTWTLMPPDR